MNQSCENLPFGDGISIDDIGTERWVDAWRRLNEDDRREFERAPSAKYLIRECEPTDIFYRDRGARLRGARHLLTVFRSGHQELGSAPGWLELDRSIWDAEEAIAGCPALASNATPDNTLRVLGLDKLDCDDPRRISPLISGFVYIDAPGGMTIGHYGARIYKDFDHSAMTLSSRLTVGFFQRMTDTRRRFDRSRMANYQVPLPFPLEIVVAPKPRIRLR